ncbi:MAG TPA: hypothetical protein VF668_15180 [Pyrinomonadaceae bacterium]|jgi:hypothetical protein
MRVRLTAVVRCALVAGVFAVAGAASPGVRARQTGGRAQSTSQSQSQSPSPSPAQSPSQERSPAQEARPAPAVERDAEADVSITARVTADSLRFEKVPNPRVEFTGRPERRTAWESERENLPEQAQPGVTYRNVGITLRIVSVFADIDRIVAEALGEVPADDESRPSPAQPSPAQPPPDQPSPARPSPAQPSSTTPGRPAASPDAPTTPPGAAAVNDRRRGAARRGRVN